VSEAAATAIRTPQTICRAGVARREITPPVGIYHRMWGAATHNRSTGVHRPLVATLLCLESLTEDSSQAFIVVNLDHCLLDDADIARIQQAVASAAKINSNQVLVAVTHTHAAGLMSRSRAAEAGGELIGPYLDQLNATLARLAISARDSLQPATIVYGHGRCNLAAHRDFYDDERGQFVCGFNPSGPADEMVLVAKIVDVTGQPLATIVNYACHPTTLAWQNTLISPDFVGALRETIETHFPAPCIFLQGASADLGPREGFVGDIEIADRNGRQLAFAALSALESLPPPQTSFCYADAVTSGATLGIWRHVPQGASERARASQFAVTHWREPLTYRADLPSLSQAEAELAVCQQHEKIAAREQQPITARDCHARAERAARRIWRLKALPPISFPLPITVARLGDAIWLFIAAEHYQSLQTALRARFPETPLLISTIASGWQPGYIPPAAIYDRGIYQEQIAVVAPGAAEQLIESIARRIESLLNKPANGAMQ